MNVYLELVILNITLLVTATIGIKEGILIGIILFKEEVTSSLRDLISLDKYCEYLLKSSVPQISNVNLEKTLNS